MSLHYKSPQEIIQSIEKIAKKLEVDPKKAVRFFVMGVSHGLLASDHQAVLREARKYMVE